MQAAGNPALTVMANAMRVCAAEGKSFIVLDRPNPINGSDVEGARLVPGYESFVGLFPIPMRHGMTIGELARLFNEAFGIGANLEVVRMEGWARGAYWDATGLPWVMPSPNMPTLDTAIAAVRGGAYDYLTKPVRRDRLQAALQRVAARP